MDAPTHVPEPMMKSPGLVPPVVTDVMTSVPDPPLANTTLWVALVELMG
jgi:hypothetical protein